MLFEQQNVKKLQQQQNKQTNIKILSMARNWTWDPLHRSRMRYLSTTETTKRID